MAVILRIRRGTTTQWDSSTKVLLVGELGIDTKLNKIKAGNGTATWEDLPWLHATPDDVSILLQSANEYTDEAITSLGNTAVETYVPISDVGNPDGVASLDENGKVPDSQIPDGIAGDSELFSGSYNDLTDKPTLFSGSYNDLTDEPDLTVYSTIASPTFTGTTTTDDLVVDGDLTVNGTNFSASATSITIEDNLLQLAHENSANTVDLGIVVGYTDGTAKHAGIVKDTSAGKWKFFKDVTTEPATTVDFTEGTLDDLEVADFTASSATINNPVVTGKITVNGTNTSYFESAYDDATGSITIDNTSVYLESITDDGSDGASVSAEAGILTLGSTTGFSSTEMYLDNLGVQIVRPGLDNNSLTRLEVFATQGSPSPLKITGDTSTFRGTVSFGNATVTGINDKLSITDPAIDYYITNSGSGSYTVNGVANGPVEFIKGKKYRIHINASGHPFWIQTVSGGYSSGNVYSTGITGNGTQVGHIIVELPQNAPDNLYYACQFHSSMAGAVLVRTDNVSFNAQSSSYTLATSDSGRLVEMSGGGTLTITDSSSFPIGFTCDVLQTGSSQVTIAGNGFTPNGTPGLKLRAQWSSATLVKRALNSWVVMGDLST